MIEIDDLAHHMEQEERERVLASDAATASIRNVHLVMAERHARRAAQAIIEEVNDSFARASPKRNSHALWPPTTLATASDTA
jgi:hypothetical protein